ncbi:MAG TPA: dienelactone hydrolase family protein, partial [Thermoanaerobaculia bacterium]
MRRIVFAVCLLTLAACEVRREQVASETATTTTPAATAAESTSSAPPAAVPSTGSPVTFGDASGYLAVPPATGKKPAVIVIQEWWGVDDWIREQTDRFAQQGYVALAVDLYRGKSAKDPDEAHELMRGMPEDRAMADLKAAFNYLASREDVEPSAIGVIGWCMGGGY